MGKNVHNHIIAPALIIVLLLTAQVCQSAASETETFWASDPLTKVMRSDLPPAEHAQPLRISGARRETVSAQAVFRPLENVAAATIAVTHLK
ncbi:MAG: hypothetical protein ACYSRZ_07790, partial [Planctomycetota bacterium]